mmetsp:Transcript_17328/g.21176  ORF Transcript_17328/g.21176 Transcript_17328/m.21176 type:complete len:718 (-) Transcript_17328:27-2180(-)
MWSIKLVRDPLDRGSSNLKSDEKGKLDLENCESVLAQAQIGIRELISSIYEKGNNEKTLDIIDAFEEGGRVARTTLAHLFSKAITDSCPNVSQCLLRDKHISCVVEPLYFMRRYNKMQQHQRMNIVGLNGKSDKKRTKLEQNSRKPSSLIPPYILERSDVWCNETTIHINVAIILEKQQQNETCNGNTLDSSNLDKVVLDYLHMVSVEAIQEENLMSHVANTVLQTKIRALLPTLDAVAFIANGSIMPRKSGASFAPMDSPPAIPFVAPNGSNLEKDISINMGKLAAYVKNENVSCSHDNNEVSLTGMIIPRGITLIVGGGYHGKSTMLRAIMAGVYNKVLGDGRELCVTDNSAVTVRAEDGRYVNNTNISAFISNLPIVGSDTTHFSSRESSGSTSQAANVVDAIEMGASAFLVDEDVSAANFMSRDGRMRALVMDESITPLLYRVNGLFDKHGISSVVVVGGVGDWLDVPSAVIRLDKYVASDALKKARSISYQFSYGHVQYGGRGTVHRLKWDDEGTPFRRRPSNADSLVDLDNYKLTLLDGGGKLSLATRSTDFHDLYNSFDVNEYLDVDLDEDIGTMDMTRCEQLLAGKHQLYGCGLCIVWILKTASKNPHLDINQLLNQLEAILDGPKGFTGVMDLISSTYDASELLQLTFGHAYRPRRYEIAMALSRMRGIKFEELPLDSDTIASLTAKEREEEDRKRMLAELWANRRKK